MALTPEQIQLLLKQEKPKRKTKGKGGKLVDDTVRDIKTWFALAHKMIDEETGESVRCSNPDCTDDRPVHMCVSINDKYVCRRCFLDGYALNSVDDMAEE